MTGFCAYGALSHVAESNLPRLRLAQWVLAVLCVSIVSIVFIVSGNLLHIGMIGTTDMSTF